MLLIGQASAWGLAIGIALLHAVPATHRPVTGAGHNLEHLAVFVLLGLAFGLGYRHRLQLLLPALSVYCLVVEAMQIVVPGRHARLADLVINTGSALLGVGLAALSIRLWQRFGEGR
jgi:VanZ family protein